jgi:2-hydroxychromene-2-carboxylate isomerase
VRRGPRLYFSFRSPFSWLLVHQLRRRVPDAHERIEFVPYWEPEPRMEAALRERRAVIHYAPMSRAKHLYILQDTKRLAAGLGLRIAWPVDVDPRWEVSHLGWLLARRRGRGTEFYEAVTAARWERGEDISDPAVIRALAGSTGLDGDAVANAAEAPGIRAEGLDRLVEAYEDDIFGVPYLRIGWHRFWGVDRLDDFLDVYLAGAARAGDPLEGVPGRLRSPEAAYDLDTAGGCG